MQFSIYQQSSNIKRSLVFLAVVIILSLLTYSQNIVNRLREESTELVRFYADIYVKAVTESDIQDFSFIFDQIILKISFPMIITQEVDSIPQFWKEVGIPSNSKDPKDLKKLNKLVVNMDRANDPIQLKYEDIVIGYIHYGDTDLIRKLQMLPFIEILVVGLFIFLGYFGFQMIRSNEKRSIWVGMAKETAHQLGTPLSSLIGWVEVLKSQYQEDDNLNEMSTDIKRLEKITHRFSKIGSSPSMTIQEINPVIIEAVKYYRRRIPQLGTKVQLIFEPQNNYYARINSYLFSWAIENLIKNSLDASSVENGVVEIKTGLTKNEKFVIIDVIDNGKGISKKDRKNIFRPGFSTKKRGWGLGLSLTSRIIKNYHKGKIFVLDSKPDIQTIMRILIPVTNEKTS